MTPITATLVTIAIMTFFWIRSSIETRRKVKEAFDSLQSELSRSERERISLLKNLGHRGIELEVAEAKAKAAHSRSESLGRKIAWIKATLSNRELEATAKLVQIQDIINE